MKRIETPGICIGIQLSIMAHGIFDKAEGRHDGSGQIATKMKKGASEQHVSPSPRHHTRDFDKAILNWY